MDLDPNNSLDEGNLAAEVLVSTLKTSVNNVKTNLKISTKEPSEAGKNRY